MPPTWPQILRRFNTYRQITIETISKFEAIFYMYTQDMETILRNGIKMTHAQLPLLVEVGGDCVMLGIGVSPTMGGRIRR
jgi:hypothetical protein